MHNLTKKDGVVVLRTVIYKDEEYLFDPEKIVQHYRKHDDSYNFYTATHYPFLHAAYHKDKNYVKVSEAYDLVETESKKHTITESENEEWAKRGKGITLEIYLPQVNELTDSLSRHGFTIEDIWYGSEPYSQFVPMTYARKK